VKTIIPSTNNTGPRALVLFLLFCAGICQGQAPPPTATNQLDASNYVCVQSGPNSKVWQSTFLSTDASGNVTTNVQSYTELATGICYLSNGQYVDSVEQVDPVPGGAQAVQGRYQVQWALNAKTPGGAVNVTTADGKQLASTVFGLAYYDVASGSNVAIAGLTNCNGAIVAPNQVLYAGAFSNLNADVLYTHTKAGMSQDIVLHQAPLPPDTYGLSDATTILQVYTEFFTPPQPQITAVTNGNITDDQILDFGDMKMGPGQALFLNAQNQSLTTGSVTKQWVQINNGTFLIESIPYQSISNELQQLPHASNLKPNRASIRRLAFQPANPAGAPVKGSTPMKLARAEGSVLIWGAHAPSRVVVGALAGHILSSYSLLMECEDAIAEGGRWRHAMARVLPEDGSQATPLLKLGHCRAATGQPRLTLDYELLSSSANLTLQGDTTYLVTSLVNITGTTTIEGGTVVKYTNSFSAEIATTNIVCLTAAYSPGVFTSMNDNSVGTVISNSSGAPARNTAAYINFGTLGTASSFVFTNLRCSYAGEAISGIGNAKGLSSITIWDCQFINCDDACYLVPGNVTVPIYVYNALFFKCAYGLNGSVLGVTAENITADQVGTFCSGSGSSVNSVFTSVTNIAVTLSGHI
jgi:hypothetical protein